MLISGIESELTKAKFNYFVESHGFAPEEVENYPDVLMDRQVEGMIFINTPLKKPIPVPVVAISDITNAPGVTRVGKAAPQVCNCAPDPLQINSKPSHFGPSFVRPIALWSAEFSRAVKKRDAKRKA